MNHQFTLHLKSTIDYHAKQLADSRGLPFIDLDAEVADNDVLESDQPAVCWQFATLADDPIDPLYAISFDIGVMTFLDPAQYVSLDLVGMFQEAFATGQHFQVMDYTGDQMPTEVKGGMTITSVGVTPHQPDRASGLRFITVNAKASRSVQASV